MGSVGSVALAEIMAFPTGRFAGLLNWLQEPARLLGLDCF